MGLILGWGSLQHSQRLVNELYYKKEQEGRFQCQKWEVFSTVLPVRTRFYFINRNYFTMASNIQKYPHPRWEVRQIMQFALFRSNPL